MKINVIDAIMGAGKTTGAINYMNDSMNCDIQKRFIYVTPYLSEVDRVMKECKFKQPVKYTDKTPKIIDLKKLLNRGDNIVTTHAMFHLFDDEVIDLCYSQGYELIMDEVTNVVEPYHIGQNDYEVLIDKYVDIQENGLLKWKEEYYDYHDDKYINEKHLCDMQCLAVYGGKIVLWMFPVKVFNAFRKSWILTYMFEGQMQKYYYDFYGMEYNYMYVAGNSLSSYIFTDKEQEYSTKYNYSDLINIVDDEKMNSIGDLDHSLSKTWYERNKSNILIEQLKNNIYNYFNNRKVLYSEGEYIKSSSTHNLWTTFKDYQALLSGKGYAKGYLPSNIRATNDWRDRTVVAYTINKYFNPLIKNFFTSHGIKIDEDAYALSEMLQFIWRSGIRDGKHISIYIPSKRMRKLLTNWILNN